MPNFNFSENVQMSEKKPKLFLLDAYALIYRSYFAFINNPRVTSGGLDTSAIFGFTTTLLEVLEKQNPTHIAIVYDTDKPTQRHEDYKEYKANREETPEAIKISMPYIKRMAEAFDIPFLGVDGYEADDVIGTLAKQAEKQGYEVYMMTPDKDFGQLVSENIYMYRPGRQGNPAEVWGIEEVKKRFEIDNVLQVIDYLGMMGDASDNIPGIPGVGKKTASKLLNQYGSMEKMYESADQIKGKLGEKIRDNQEQALMSKKLATIQLDAPIKFDPDAFKREKFDQERIREIFSELEFRALLKRVTGDEIKETKEEQGDLFTQNTAINPDLQNSSSGYSSLDDTDHLYWKTCSNANRYALTRKPQTCKAPGPNW